jgi:hypothetical protein
VPGASDPEFCSAIIAADETVVCVQLRNQAAVVSMEEPDLSTPRKEVNSIATLTPYSGRGKT